LACHPKHSEETYSQTTEIYLTDSNLAKGEIRMTEKVKQKKKDIS
jgi:hypothetical protein